VNYLTKESGLRQPAFIRTIRTRRQTDIEDARTVERAKSAHGGKPRIPWAQVKKEAGLD
jgi:hypothetical protein